MTMMCKNSFSSWSLSLSICLYFCSLLCIRGRTFLYKTHILYVTSRTDLWVASFFFRSRSILLSSPSLLLLLLLHFLNLYDSCWFFIFTFWYVLVGPSLTNTTHVDLLWLTIPFVRECVCVCVWLAFLFRVTVCIYMYINIYVMVFGYI